MCLFLGLYPCYYKPTCYFVSRSLLIRHREEPLLRTDNCFFIRPSAGGDDVQAGAFFLTATEAKKEA